MTKTASRKAAEKAYDRKLMDARAQSPSPSVDEVALEAFREWYRRHTGKWLTRSNARKAITAYLASLVSPPKAGAWEPVAWACVKCNSPRSIDPCQKCGTPLTKPADGWDWPRLPDIDRIRALAREVGYAIGVHGSLERDLDLIAAPWVTDAVTPFKLAQHIATGLGGSVLDYKTQDKPCGRWSCNINADGWFKLIDLSVMPPVPSDVVALSLALKPFADMAGDYDPEEGDDDQAAWLEYPKVGWLRKARSALASPAANHEAHGDGVRVTDQQVEAAAWSILLVRFYNPEPEMYASLDAFYTDMRKSDHWPEALEEARAALEAALAYHAPVLGETQPGLGSIAETQGPLGDGRAEIVEATRPTFDDLRAAIEQSRNRNVAGGGWCLTDKQADTALEWSAFLEGIGAPCPKIAGFDEGLQLVWPGNHRHYLILGDDAEGFVLNVDAKGHRRSLSNLGDTE